MTVVFVLASSLANEVGQVAQVVWLGKSFGYEVDWRQTVAGERTAADERPIHYKFKIQT